MTSQKKTLSHLDAASRYTRDAISDIRSAQASYQDADYVYSLLSSAQQDVERVKREIDDAVALVRRKWGIED